MTERRAFRLSLAVVLLASFAACLRWWAAAPGLLEDPEAAWRKYTAVVCGVVALAALAVSSPPDDRRPRR